MCVSDTLQLRELDSLNIAKWTMLVYPISDEKAALLQTMWCPWISHLLGSANQHSKLKAAGIACLVFYVLPSDPTSI